MYGPLQWYRDNIHIVEDEYSKVVEFIFLWQEYNYYYHHEFPDIGDCRAALNLYKKQVALEYYETIKDECINAFMRIRSRDKNNNPRTYLCKDSRFQRKVEYNVNGHDTLRDFLSVVYQIRNNFLHGEKLWNENKEIDIKLISWAKDYLEKLLNGSGIL